MNYHNEFDPFAADWLEQLIQEGHIAPGVVDRRDIRDVHPNDLKGFTQHHFFAGIGGWPYALRLAGWPDDRPIASASCPCQPFSAAGRGLGFVDERHLWPAFFHLVRECGFEQMVGEQVASKDGLGWLDLVQADLEGEGYATGAVDLCAAGVGAPHIRQRLWWMAYKPRDGRQQRRAESDRRGAFSSSLGALGHHHHQRRYGLEAQPEQAGRRIAPLTGGPVDTAGEQAGLPGRARQPGSAVGHHQRARLEGCDDRALGYEREALERTGAAVELGVTDSTGPQPGDKAAATLGYGHSAQPTSFWSDPDWIYCRDDKWRPVEPGTFPLAHRVSGRVGKLRGYGNAITTEAAKIFIEACLDTFPR